MLAISEALTKGLGKLSAKPEQNVNVRDSLWELYRDFLFPKAAGHTVLKIKPRI